MAFTVKYTRTSYHIAGIVEATKGSDLDYALSACPALSRSGSRMAVGGTHEDLTEALSAAQSAARVRGARVCEKCQAAAERVRGWVVGDVVTLGSDRLHDVTRVSAMDRMVEVWPQDEGDERSGQWLSFDHTPLHLARRA